MKLNNPFVSIIIPTRNVGKFISKCLESLNNLDYPKDKYEVIIADSESTDETPSIARKYGAILVSTAKRSVCAGRNEGFKIAKGEIIAFSDADCVMDKNWIKNSIKYFEDSVVGGVGGPNLSPADDTSFAKAVSFVLDQPLFLAGSVYGRVLKNIKEVKSLPGCNIILRRETLDKVMPIDETILGGEDFFMNQKIRQLGYRLLYTPDTFVWHYHRAAPKKFFKQIYRYGISRLIIGKKDRRMINPMHIIVGFGVPILAATAFSLIIFSPVLLAYIALSAAVFMLIYTVLAWFKLKSFRAALWVPTVIVIIFCSWSLGFLRELFCPISVPCHGFNSDITK
ncbi:MAG: glycosyltransferase [Candidatus Nealsonbacteria bacterium]|nr:glycosyltransferase [Candidatus Nealsonbacteria bacterium]